MRFFAQCAEKDFAVRALFIEIERDPSAQKIGPQRRDGVGVGSDIRTCRPLTCSNVRPDPSFSSLAGMKSGPSASQRRLGSGLTFEHLKSQMSEYQTLPQPIVASGLLRSDHTRGSIGENFAETF
jgi:hypothetical protein